MLWGFTCKCICTTVWHIFLYTTYILYVDMFLNKRINPFFTFFFEQTQQSVPTPLTVVIMSGPWVTRWPACPVKCGIRTPHTPTTTTSWPRTRTTAVTPTPARRRGAWPRTLPSAGGTATYPDVVRWCGCVHIRRKPFFEDFDVELIHEIKCWMNLNF